MVMNKGQAFAFALWERSILSDVRMIGMMVEDFAFSESPEQNIRRSTSSFHISSTVKL